MRHRDGDAGQQHRREVGRDRASGLPDREGDGETDQQRLSRKPRGGERQQGAADRDADGIAGDQIAGGRDRDLQPVGHIRQHAGNDELGGAERKGGDEEGNEGKRHEGFLRLLKRPQTTDGQPGNP